MTAGAVKVLAALTEAEQTETELATASGLGLTEVRTALDELLLTGGGQEDTDGALRVYRKGTN